MTRTKRIVNSAAFNVAAIGILSVVVIAALIIALIAQGQSASVAKKQASESNSELHRLQDAFCGTYEHPGLLPVIASAPITAQTSVLGHELVVGSQRASGVIHCPPLKK